MANAGNGIVDGSQIGIESEEIGSISTEVDEKRLSGSVPTSKKALGRRSETKNRHDVMVVMTDLSS